MILNLPKRFLHYNNFAAGYPAKPDIEFRIWANNVYYQKYTAGFGITRQMSGRKPDKPARYRTGYRIFSQIFCRMPDIQNIFRPNTGIQLNFRPDTGYQAKFPAGYRISTTFPEGYQISQTDIRSDTG